MTNHHLSIIPPSYHVTKSKYLIQIHTIMLAEGYNPWTWRTNSSHMLPLEAEEISWDDPRTSVVGLDFPDFQPELQLLI